MNKTKTNNVEGSTDVIGSITEDQATLASPEAQNVSTDTVDPLEAIVDTPESLQTLKDAWGRPIPTKVVLIEAITYNKLVDQVLHAASLGAKLDPTFDVRLTIPLLARVLLPEDKYEDYLANKGKVVYNTNTEYNKVTVKSVDRNEFFKVLMEVGNSGVVVDPTSAPYRVPIFSVIVLTRNPIPETINTVTGWKKVNYTREELESFSISELCVILKWYKGTILKSKDKCVKSILGIQESKKKDVE